jgi:hypothetical protein
MRNPADHIYSQDSRCMTESTWNRVITLQDKLTCRALERKPIASYISPAAGIVTMLVVGISNHGNIARAGRLVESELSALFSTRQSATFMPRMHSPLTLP